MAKCRADEQRIRLGGKEFPVREFHFDVARPMEDCIVVRKGGGFQCVICKRDIGSGLRGSHLGSVTTYKGSFETASMLVVVGAELSEIALIESADEHMMPAVVVTKVTRNTSGSFTHHFYGQVVHKLGTNDPTS